MLLALTITVLFIPAALILLYQYAHGSLTQDAASGDPLPDNVREFPRAA